MGNEQPKKIPRINKSQVQMAALKAKIHLELMRDRKTQQIIKGEKELVAKLNAKSRNHTEQILIMERVVNGLKYTQAVNQLIAYATSLRSQAGFLCQNIGNQEKLEPWLTQVHSLLYAADHLGLSSLNEFKGAMRALNDPLLADKFVNPEIKQMLSPTPTFYEVNIYVLEMCERNQIDLEVVNSAGHKFSHDPQPPNQERKSFTDIEKQLASKFQKQLHNNQGNQPNQGNQGNQGFNSGNGGWGNQGGFGGNQGGFNGNNGGFGGNQGGFNGGFNGNSGNLNGQGFNPNPTHNQTPAYYDNSLKTNNYESNPYKGVSNIQEAPNYYTPSQIQQNQNQQKPNQFLSFDDVNLRETRNTVDPIYPSVNPNGYQNQTYTPQNLGGNGGYGNGSGNGNGQVSGETKSPTISQIMRDFDLK